MLEVILCGQKKNVNERGRTSSKEIFNNVFINSY